MQALFEAIRRAASAQAWSRGVELARSEAVTGESADDSEIALRVTTPGRLVALGVTLYPEDGDWECQCSSAEPACEHVAAAAIAVRQARSRGLDLPAPAKPAGTLRYRLARESGDLRLEREVVTGGSTEPLRSSLEAIARGRVDGPSVSATSADLAVERALGPRHGGVLPPGLIEPVLDALSSCSDVLLDGEPVRVSRERLRPRARLSKVAGGFELRLEPDDAISEEIASGVVRCGDTLRIVAESRLTGRELEELPGGRVFSGDEVPALVTEVLPSLADRIDLAIETDALPQTRREPPRIVLEVERLGEKLSLLPTLVYGDPACARVDAGRLVHLGGAVPLRDEAAERQRVRHLQQELGLAPGHRVEAAGPEAVALAERLSSWTGEIRGDAHESFYRCPALTPRLEIEGDDFRLDFASRDESGDGPTRSASADSVLRAWRNGEALVSLLGGGFAPLPADWLERFGDRVADLLAARGDADELPTCALPDLARLCEELGAPPPPGLARLAPLAHGIPASEPPPDLRATLRPYQRTGVDWLCFLRDTGLGALLADDMGLGKTLQAIYALRGRTFVVAPTSVLHSWQDELERFRPGLRAHLYHGAGRVLPEDADVVLTSYAILRLDADVLAEQDWDVVVLDEAQNIKNPDSQVARAACRLKAAFRIALTGTPVENRLEELWSQLHFLNRGLLGSRRDFQERYAKRIADGDADALEHLRTRIGPFLMRRLKRDVAPELPPRSEIVLHCELSDAEREVYDSVRAASVGDAVRQLQAGGGVMAALEALLRLRQAACHAGLVPGQAADTSSKLELLVDRCEQAAAEGHRALVFSQWTSLLDLVEPALRAASLDFARLDGSTRDRAAVVRGFQDEAGPPLMLVSLKAGGTGLNLTAADHIFLLDPWWNPAVEDQAADRAHRIGQERPVVVHRLVAADTVEERILELQRSKRALADAALAGTDPAASLGREDLLELLT